MKVVLHPEIEALLKDMHTGDISRVVNDILLVYAKGGFIRETDIEKRFILKDVYRKSNPHLAPVFEEVTSEFVGFAVTGVSDSETLWVADQELHEAISAHSEVLVMKSPRKRGIRSKKGDYIPAKSLHKDSFS